MELVLVTGMSGAGKSQAANMLEDMGFYCVDNVPPMLFLNFIELSRSDNSELERLALVTDARGGKLFSQMEEVLALLDEKGIRYRILFLDASDEVLMKRYKENRRKHPLCREENLSLGEAVKTEREMLRTLRQRADYLIDTAYLSVAQLKEKISSAFCEDAQSGMEIVCESFGFKFGPNREADLVLDVRCLPNPYYVPELKEKTGLEKEVREYVLSTPESREFLNRLLSFVEYSVPLYAKEGKSQLVIAFGCTGGKHRSVTFAETVGQYLREKQYRCSVTHRDAFKR